jgi:hypothetical protein
VAAHRGRRTSHRCGCQRRCAAGRIRPGTPLLGGDDPVIVEVAAGLLARLHLTADGEFPVPALEDIYVRTDSQARDDADFEQ